MAYDIWEHLVPGTQLDPIEPFSSEDSLTPTEPMQDATAVDTVMAIAPGAAAAATITKDPQPGLVGEPPAPPLGVLGFVTPPRRQQPDVLQQQDPWARATSPPARPSKEARLQGAFTSPTGGPGDAWQLQHPGGLPAVPPLPNLAPQPAVDTVAILGAIAAMQDVMQRHFEGFGQQFQLQSQWNAQTEQRLQASVAQAQSALDMGRTLQDRVDELQARVGRLERTPPPPPRSTASAASSASDAFVPSAIYLQGWTTFDDREDQGLSPDDCNALVRDLSSLVDVAYKSLLEGDVVRAGRQRNSRILVRVEGGRDRCFKLAAALRTAISAHSVKRNGKLVKVSIEDSPAARDRKGQIIRAARTLELKLPRGVVAKIDWPDRIYAFKDDRLGGLLARFPFGARSVSWIEANIQEHCPGISAAELDEAMEQL